MTAHYCHTEDGHSIACLCRRGVDHNEAEWDVPVGQQTPQEDDE